MKTKKAPALIAATMTRGRAGLMRSTALQAVAILIFATPAMAQPAPNARPAGGVVVGGSASIGQTANATTINQASQRAAIDWRSFDVGANQTVQFNQPGASAIALNRVTGPDPSQIAGRIQANGQVVITNQSGVMFHQGAQVETAGLIVSAAGITPQNFMAGRMVFDQAAKPDAMVSNAGTITIKQAGLAALVAPRVANSGVIQAKMGRVVLAGAETHTIDMYGDGLLSIDVTQQVRQAPRGADGKPVTALVTNTGTIVADGGSIVLTAAAADGIVQNLVQAGGRIQANAAGGRAGSVVLAGVGGSVQIEGRVAADGRAPGSVGGTVTAQATDGVTVASRARVTANGAAGGGTVAIGTRAGRSVTVQAGAKIEANARKTGNGGQVALISGGVTTLDGSVAARGGRTGGNGGAVEVSGATLGITGQVDTGAPAGKVGHILLDPTDVTITSGTGSGTVVTPASLEAMVGDVTVQADNSIVAASSVTFGFTARGAPRSLTLDAGNFIRVDPGVTLDVTGGLNLVAGAGGVSILGNLTPRAAGLGLRFTTTGAVTQGAASVITAPQVTGTVGSASLSSTLNQIAAVGANDVTFTASAGDIRVASAAPLTATGFAGGPGIVVPTGRSITLIADTIAFAASGGTVVSAPGGVIALQPLTAGRPIEVTSTAATAGTLSIAAGSLNLLDTATLTLGTAGGGAISLQPTGAAAIDFGAAGIATLNLLSGGAITQGGAIAVTTLSGSAATITLGNVNNFIPNVGPLTATGDILFHTGDTLAVNGAVRGANVALSSGGTTTPSMVLNADVSGATVSLDTFNGGSLSTSGSLVQNAGVVTATTLTGQAQSVRLNLANQVSGLGAFTTSGAFALTTATPLQLAGALATGIVGSVTLNAGGAITQTAGSRISTPTLSGAAPSANFSSANNVVQALRDFSTSVGDLALTTQLSFVTGISPPLSLGGVIAAPAGRSVSIVADRVVTAAGASVSAPGGTIAFSPLTAGRGMELVTTAAEQNTAALSLNQADLARLQTGTLQFGAATAGPILVGNAGNTLDLTGRAATLSLISGGAVTQGAGAALTVPTLTGTAASVALGGPNAIGTLGALTTTGAATVTDAGALAVAGPVTAGGTAALTAGGLLTLAGTVSAPTIQLAGGAAGIAQTGGLVTTPGTLNVATTGAITQGGGSITANTLTGSAGSVALTSAGNLIVNLGPFTTTGDFALRDGRGLTIAGAVDPGDVTLTVAGDLAINNSVTGVNVTLNVTGNITEVAGGSVVATTLLGSAATARLDQGNAVGTLAGFATTGGFVLANATGLAVTGPVTDGASIVLSSVGPMTLSGVLTAPTISLTATNGIRPARVGSITQTAGTITAATSLALNAADAVLQTGGSIVAGQVGGSSGLSTALNQAGNQVGTLAGYSSVGGFSLRDGQSLAQVGALSDTAQIGLNVAGGLTLNGTLTAPLVNLVATGAVSQPGGSIAATTLTGSTGTATLNAGGNAITNLGAFTSLGSFSLIDSAALNVTGAVVVTGLGPSLSLGSNSIALQPGGSLTAAGGTVTLAPYTAGTAFNLSSLVPAGGTTAITADTLQVGNAGAGPITVNGAFNLAGVGTLQLISGGAITETATGSLTVGTLAATGASLSLGGPNQIGALGAVTTTGGVAVTNAQGLTVTGPVRDGVSIRLDVTGGLSLAGALSAPTVTLNASGAITQTLTGPITATTLTGSAGSAALGAANVVTNLGAFTTTGDFQLSNQFLTTTGAVSGANVRLDTVTLAVNSVITGGNVVLNGQTSITEGAGGQVVATVLSGSAGTTQLTQANKVSTLGGFTSGFGFALTTTGALTVTGPVSDGRSIALNAGSITLAGTVSASAVNLVTPGALTQTAGALTATTLSGSAASVSLGSAGNVIFNLGGLTTTGAMAITDSRGLAITAPIAPGSLALTVAGDLGINAAVTTGTATLNATGTITEGAGGSLTATTLTGSAGTAVLNAAGNAIDNLGAFASAGPFSLVDSRALNVTGAVSSGGASPSLSLASDTIALQPGGSLTANGGTIALAPYTPGAAFNLTSFVPTGSAAAITANTLQVGSAAAGPITIDGAFNLSAVPTLQLLSSGAITETATGSLTVGVLRATAGSLALNGANRIGALGDIATTGGLSLTNVQALSVTGALTDPGAIRLGVTGDLSLAGTLTAPTVTLNASGAISQPGGAITATTLTGTAGSANFASAANQIVNLGPFNTTGDFALRDGRSLAVVAPVDPGDVTITVNGDLVLNSTVTGNTVTFNVTGNITEGAAGSVIATTLQGVAATARFDQSNTVGTLGGFTSAGGFVLSDATGLAVAGPVVDGVSVALRSAGPLTVSGDITAPLISLTAVRGVRPATAGSITQTGGTIGASGDVVLTAADGVTQAGGAIAAGRLLGSSGGATSLGQAGNQIATLGSYSSVGGFSLRDGRALSQAGSLSDTASIALNVAGALTLGGTVSAPTVNLVASGAATEVAGGSISATTLTGTVGSASLNQATNAVANLGAFASGGDATLAFSGAPNLVGAVSVGSGATLTLNAAGLNFQPGGSLAAPGGTVVVAPVVAGTPFALGSFLPAGSASAVTANTFTVGNATAGNLSLSGAYNLSNVGTLNLVSGGSISEAAGASLTAPRLTASGTTVTLDQANVIGTLGAVTAGGGFTLSDGATPLTVAGAVAAGGPITLSAGSITLGTAATVGTLATPGLVTLNAGNGFSFGQFITQPNGAISAGSLAATGYGISLGGANRVTTLAGIAANGLFSPGSIISGGQFVFNNLGALTVAGPIAAQTSPVSLQTSGALTLAGNVTGGTVTLNAGSIAQTGGLVSASTLNVAANDAALSGNVGTIGSVVVPGIFSLVNGVSSTVAGVVNVGTLNLSGGFVTIAGGVTAGTMNLAVTGVGQTAGTLQVGTLSGSAAQSALFGSSSANGPRAAIGTLAGFSAPTSLTVVDTVPLVVSGATTGFQLNLSAPGSVTLQGGSIATGAATISTTGQVIQTGTTQVTRTGTGVASLQIATSGGAISLQNLVAPNVALTLAPGTGRVTGNITVADLLVNGSGGSAVLTGVVAGASGFDAAIRSRITPQFDTAYTMNGCAIASVTCTPIVPPAPTPAPTPTPPAPIVRLVVPSAIVPSTQFMLAVLRPERFTADLVMLDVVRDPTDPSLTLPNISGRDY